MQKPLMLLQAAACAGMLFLAACNSQPETITSGPADDMAGVDNASGAPTKLPPMMTSSKTYRCDDNSLVYIDFFNDGVTAHVRKEKTGTPTVLTAPEKGKPFAAEGYTLDGTGDSVKLAMPGKKEQSCKA